MAYRSSSDFPGFSRLYVWEEPGNSRAFRGRISLSNAEALAQTRSEAETQGVKLEWAMGAQKPSDVIRATIAPPIIMSERVRSLLDAFSGWKPYPVEVWGRDGTTFGGYNGLAVQGRCGFIETARSLPFEKTMPGGRFIWFRGLYFDPATWDGSDIFMPMDKVGWVFVVESVRTAFLRSKVKNVVFTPLSEIERMTAAV